MKKKSVVFFQHTMLDFVAEIVRPQIEIGHKVSICLPLYWPTIVYYSLPITSGFSPLLIMPHYTMPVPSNLPETVGKCSTLIIFQHTPLILFIYLILSLQPRTTCSLCNILNFHGHAHSWTSPCPSYLQLITVSRFI